ncbi:MAG TPA: lipocalin family protein [Pedobacter sp.]|uniref:lipocalin family protein n=1 Tax=Pedobacter sp. TaxID=1411316 RepID=UPI002CC3D961|nr:lipocalin family protein [Pedobacter sp.]HMI04646.1 lipocalin family protein [Pedobacter sp.]
MDNNNINPKLKELTERLSGKWQVKGQEIDGEAEYKSMKGGFLLVMNVDFVVDGKKIKNIQHVAYDQDTDTLRAHYMDTKGDDSTYTWVLEGQKIRVSLGGKDSDTYFEATLNDDDSEYTGTWHYPDGGDQDAGEARIVYKRIK